MQLKKILNKKQRIRKSGMEDIFFVIVALIGFSLFFLILHKIWGDVSPVLKTGLESSGNISAVNTSKVLDQTTGTTTTYNTLFPFLLIGLFGFVLISASFIFQHPIMLIVGIILLGVAIILAVAYANIYHQISQTDEFSASTAQFPIMDKFMNFLPYIVFILFLIIGAVVYLRKSSGGGGL